MIMKKTWIALPVAVMVAVGACSENPTGVFAPTGPSFHHDFTSAATVTAAVDATAVEVTWSAGRTHGVNAPTGYVVQLVEVNCTGAACTGPSATTGATTLTHTFSAVPDGAYQARVRTSDGDNTFENGIYSQCFAVGTGSCTATPAPAETQITEVSGSGTYGSTATLVATLASEGSPLADKIIVFSLSETAVCGDAPLAACPTTDADGVATLAGISLSGINAGTYVNAVRATFNIEPGFLGSHAEGDLVVAKANQMITFDPIDDVLFAIGGTVSVSATATSGLTVSFTSLTSAVCTVSSGTVSMVKAGTCTIRASQVGDSNYNAAPDVDRSFEIEAWTFEGFFSPVKEGVVNRAKSGSTVPLGFRLWAGGTEITSTTGITFSAVQISCSDAGTVVDEANVFATSGKTELRYEDGAFKQNWQTPRSPNTCYRATATAPDGSTLPVNFMLNR
jgi:hypothetical protein